MLSYFKAVYQYIVTAHKEIINPFKYPFHAGRHRETSLSNQHQGGESKWNTEPAFAHLPASDSSSHPTQQRGPWAETRSENKSCTPASSAKDKGPTGDFASRRELNQECLSHGTDFAPCPSTTNSNQPPLQPDLWQCRDKGPSTNKALTSTLLFCCPNEPTGPGSCAAAIWDIQSCKKKFPSLSHVLVINKPPSTGFQTFASFIGMKSAGKCGEETALPNPDGSLGRNN